MAEIVNRNLENFLFEINDLKECNIFSEAECKTMKKQLEHYQYRIGRVTKDLQDFKCLIDYLSQLLQTVLLKESTDRHTKVSTNLKSRLMHKINFYYEQAMHYFPYDKELALEYLDFISHNPLVHVSVPRRINNIIQKFHTEPEIFQIAACCFRKDDPRKAIDILLKGLSHHPSNSNLYLDIIELELAKPEPTNEETRLKIYIDSIQKHINDYSILICILKMLLNYDSRLFSVAVYITDILLDKYKTNEHVWNAIALMELKGCYYKASAEEIANKSFSISLERSVKRFKEGLKELPKSKHAALWKLYLETLFDDNYYNKDPATKQIYDNTLKNVLEEAISQGVNLIEQN